MNATYAMKYTWLKTLSLTTAVMLFTASDAVQMQVPTFQAEAVSLPMESIVLQHTPHPTNNTYYVLDKNNRYYISGTQMLEAYVGDCIKLSWDSRTDVGYVIQWSTNQVDWFDIKVRIQGNGSKRIWYDNYPSKYYRLVSTPLPPERLRRT